MPLAYAGLALVVAVAVLPTALRPPQLPPPSSGALSPDAPPDDQQIVLSELGRGASVTAGVGVAVGEGVAGQVPAPAPAGPAMARRGRCFGNPPRQTESLYSAPCAAAFTGDNGGATSKGVTANEINIGVHWGGSYDGPLKPPAEDDSTDGRVYRTWQAYFNERYELYGRKLRLIMINTTGVDPAVNKAAVAGADSQWPLFGFFGASLYYPAYEEAIRRKAVVFDADADLNHDWLQKNHPYAYSWRMHMQKAIGLTGEIMCKQFVGKPPEFNERMDPTFDYTKPRKFGLIAYEEQAGYRLGAPDVTRAELAKCGGKVEEVSQYNLYDEQQFIASSVTKMRAAGVTTILLWTENVTPLVLTQEATNQGYFPEWFNMPTTWQTTGLAQSYSQQQWRHAMSTFGWELPRPAGFDDCAVAYKSQDPDNAAGACQSYRVLQQYANGIQLTGPKLTPETFWAGLKRTPCRAPVPEWSIAGCYRDGDLTYPDYVALGWWDPNADPPDDADPGGYRFMYGGKRFTVGEIPPQSPWFKEGLAAPADPVQRE